MILDDAGRTHSEKELMANRALVGRDAEQRVITEVINELFGMAGLQPLLDDPTIETINANRFDRVFVQYNDGRRVRVAPIAGSNEELTDLVRLLAARASSQECRFDYGSPAVNLQLPGGERLCAILDRSDQQLDLIGDPDQLQVRGTCAQAVELERAQNVRGIWQDRGDANPVRTRPLSQLVSVGSQRMITSSTYRDQVDLHRDLLAAFSALDHRTTAELTPKQMGRAFRELVARLSALLFLHGPGTPAAFLEAIDRLDLDAQDPVEVVAEFLETGRANAVGLVDRSELQQEIVHFSRIVDIGTLGLDDGASSHAVRRLRNSVQLPQPLKVLSELAIVLRSRILQRGSLAATPSLRASRPTSRELNGTCSLWSPDEGDYALVTMSPRRRTRKQAAYLFSTLLDYLTPLEAVVALWAYVAGNRLRAPLGLTLVTDAEPSGSMVSWSHPGGDLMQSELEPIAWCHQQLPVVTPLPVATAVHPEQATIRASINGVTIAADRRASGAVAVSVMSRDEAPLATLDIRATARSAVSISNMVEQATRLVDGYDGPSVASIECGHIHLDRDLDIDQQLGATLGARVMAILAKRQREVPRLTPMMDDDHVLVKLRPTAYRAFLAQHFDHQPLHLIVESSPIIRSIVCALCARLRRLGLTDRCQERGKNLFLALGDGHFCELFEDVSGDNATGCVFFETALLIYRCAPRQFDDHFRTRFGLAEGLHERACTILDGPEKHDGKVARLQEFYSTFAAVTAPDRPDPAVVALVDEVIANRRGVAHLNVLEDYYEVQQGKVRALLDVLELPVRLVSLHFNAQTGRVVLDQ